MSNITNILDTLAVKLTTGQTGIPNTKANEATLANILNTVYMFAGIVAIVAIIIGAYWYVTSAGNAESIKRGKNAILYAVIGLVVTIMAYAITNFVIGRL